MTLTRLNALSPKMPQFGLGKSDAGKAEEARLGLSGLSDKQKRDQFGLPLTGYTVGNTQTNGSFVPLYGKDKEQNGFSFETTKRSEFFTYA